MNDTPVTLSAEGPGETVLPPEDASVLEAYADALRNDDPLLALSEVVSANPRFLLGWAKLGDLASKPLEAYAYYRIGYHRGLDALRASGWRGSQYVRWRHPENHGFLAALAGLQKAAGQIGEQDEVARVRQFLHQLDPDWDDQTSGLL